MASPQDFPAGYTPYKTVHFCGNTLVDVKYIIKAGDFVPLLIGKGPIPKIWLFRKEPSGTRAVLIEKTQSYVRDLSIHLNVDSRQIGIVFDNGVVKLEVMTINFTDDEVTVSKLDLQIAYLQIFGDSEKLEVGNAVIKGTKMVDIDTFIAIE